MSTFKTNNSHNLRVREAYNGFFENVRIFTVGRELCDDCPSKSFVVDVKTGRLPSLLSTKSFNDEMDKSSHNLINFDKACLYLDFNGLSVNTTPTSVYYKHVVKGAIYTPLNAQGLVGYGNLTVNWRTYQKYWDQSDKQHIYLGGVTNGNRQNVTLTIYRFEFNKNGRLITVTSFEPE